MFFIPDYMGIFQLRKLIELNSYDMWILYMYRSINTFMYVTLKSKKKKVIWEGGQMI